MSGLADTIDDPFNGKRIPLLVNRGYVNGREAKVPFGKILMISKDLKSKKANRTHERRERRARLGQRTQNIEECWLRHATGRKQKIDRPDSQTSYD